MKWQSKTTYVDIDTGEIIDKRKIKEYIIIKTIRKTKNYKNEYIRECKRTPQTRINFNNT